MWNYCLMLVKFYFRWNILLWYWMLSRQKTVCATIYFLCFESSSKSCQTGRDICVVCGDDFITNRRIMRKDGSKNLTLTGNTQVKRETVSNLQKSVRERKDGKQGQSQTGKECKFASNYAELEVMGSHDHPHDVSNPGTPQFQGRRHVKRSRSIRRISPFIEILLSRPYLYNCIR